MTKAPAAAPRAAAELVAPNGAEYFIILASFKSLLRANVQLFKVFRLFLPPLGMLAQEAIWNLNRI